MRVTDQPASAKIEEIVKEEIVETPRKAEDVTATPLSTTPPHTPVMPCFCCVTATNLAGHYLSECPTISKVNPTRIALVLKAESRCIRCFEKCVYSGPTSHLSSNCTYMRHCSICKSSNHHGLLHGASRTSKKKWIVEEKKTEAFTVWRKSSLKFLVWFLFNWCSYYLFVFVRLSEVSSRAHCAARRRVIEFFTCFVVAVGP